MLYSCTHMATVGAKGLNIWRVSVSDHLWRRQIGLRRTRTTQYGDRCFAVAGPRVWNSSPTELRQSDSLGQFKRRLKRPICLGYETTAPIVTFCNQRFRNPLTYLVTYYRSYYRIDYYRTISLMAYYVAYTALASIADH